MVPSLRSTIRLWSGPREIVLSKPSLKFGSAFFLHSRKALFLIFIQCEKHCSFLISKGVLPQWQDPDGISVYRLFYVLEGVESFLTCSYFDDVLYIVDEDLAITDMTGVKYFLCGIDNSLYRYSRYHDIHLDLREQ